MNPSLCIIKSDFANLYSVQNALKSLGTQATISDDPAVIHRSDAVIFPGVGHFAQVKEDLDQRGLTPVIKNVAMSGKPFLGICLGMQILFDKSAEGEQTTEGLGLLEGEVVPIPPSKVDRIPHIGWNSLNLNQAHKNDPIFNEQAETQVYFVHSFYCAVKEQEQVLASTELAEGFEVPVMVKKNNIYGMQFHPERSGQVGLKFLSNFVRLAQSIKV
jgi:imidazole glycerol-phosphate synthase subunit HisH